MDADDGRGTLGDGGAGRGEATRRKKGARSTMIDESTTRKIREQLDSAPVVLFMKGTPDFPQCGFSAQTAGALRSLKATYKHVNIFEERSEERRVGKECRSRWSLEH